MLNIHLSDRDGRQRLSLKLSSSPEWVNTVFDALTDEEHPALQIMAAETSVTHLQDYLVDKFVDRGQGIRELDFLSRRIKGMTNQEKDILGAMFDIEKPRSLMEIVNLSCNMDKFVLYPEARNHTELGKAVMEREHTDILEGTPSSEDYRQKGKDYAASHAGTFSKSGYVVRTGEALESLYDGKHLPDPGYEKKGRFLLHLCPDGASSYQSTCSLSLPASEEKMDVVRENLGIRDFDECRLLGMSSSVRDLKNHLPCSYDICDLNHFAAILSEKVMDGTEENVMRLFAALEAEVPDNMKAVVEIAANLEHYKILPEEIRTPMDYADHVLNKAEIFIDDEMKPFVDYEGFGKYRMQKDGVVQTAHGLVLRDDRPIRQLPEELTTLKLFSPLYSQLYVRTEWGDGGNSPVNMYPDELCRYQDEILAAIERENRNMEWDNGFADYLDNELLKRKVHSMMPTVEEWDGRLWGVLEVQSYGPLSGAELSGIMEEWSGQESDGWGEGFEQREIRVDQGELCVSFWDSDKNFFIKTEQELKDQPKQGFGMQMGGM